MGGLVVKPNLPAAKYEFEMISKDNAEGNGTAPLLHFKVKTPRN